MGRGSPVPGGLNRKVLEGLGKHHLGEWWDVGGLDKKDSQRARPYENFGY